MAEGVDWFDGKVIIGGGPPMTDSNERAGTEERLPRSGEIGGPKPYVGDY